MATATKARKAKPRAEIGADEARQALGGLMNRVAAGGERVVLTRHGAGVVAIVSMEDLNALEKSDVAA